MDSKDVYAILQPLGLKPLNKIWAKLEIIAGLAAAFLGLEWGLAICDWRNAPVSQSFPDLHYLAASLALFVLGGYLAMAGHRSHLYQSNNQLTAFLVSEVRKIGAKVQE